MQQELSCLDHIREACRLFMCIDIVSSKAHIDRHGILDEENLFKHFGDEQRIRQQLVCKGKAAAQHNVMSAQERTFYYFWTKRLSAPNPVCRFARPPMGEVVLLLPIAYRLSNLIAEERYNGSNNVIFDMDGLMLEPPSTGAYFGVPVGGLGTGAMGRGYTGEFRRFSLDPGKVIKKTLHANQFSIRVKRGGVVHCKVLSVATTLGSSKDADRSNDALRAPPRLLSSWGWGLDPRCARYHALFPLSSTVYEEPVPGVKVTVHQVIPVIPHNYSDSSLPASLFMVDVENLRLDSAEVSVMFTFQNGCGADNEVCGEHQAFEYLQPTSSSLNTDTDSSSDAAADPMPSLFGILMNSKRSTNVVDKRRGLSKSYEDTNSYSIAASCDDVDTVVSFNRRFVISRKIKIMPSKIISGLREHDINDIAGLAPLCNDNASSAALLWTLFEQDGIVNDVYCPGRSDLYRSDDRDENRGDRDEIRGSAICVKKTLPPRSKSTYSFSLAFSHPVARFGSGSSVHRQFTRFVGGAPTSAALAAVYALQNGRSWLREAQRLHADTISAVRRDHSMFQPSQFEEDAEGKIVSYIKELFNELYYLVDGGCIWSTETPLVHEDLLDLPSALRLLPDIAAKMTAYSSLACAGSGNSALVGRFLYLEGHEYLMYNTYDVHFYGSFALTMLWPQLELSIQRDFALAVAASDDAVRRMLFDGRSHKRKMRGGVPHDLGSPFEEPWEKLNSYNLQDVTNWKDLGSKFVVQTFRDYLFIKRHPLTMDTNAASTFLGDLYRTVLEVMDSCERKYDLDRDGMIENSGFPDQTYDVWSASGVHAYCGGLWVAACSAAAAMAAVMGDKVGEVRFLLLHSRAQSVYMSKLWNGSYLLYDSSSSYHSDSIMADSMCGHAYSRLCGLPSVMPAEAAVSCYQTIFDFNVLKFSEIAHKKGRGRTAGHQGAPLIGAVNGMRPNGTVDQTCMQSREVWTGVTYFLAAGLLAESHEHQRRESVEAEDGLDGDIDQASATRLREMAFDTANGVARGKELFGFHFNTPEAWEADGAYRSAGYMRPLSVWAMQFAIDTRAKNEKKIK